MKLLYCLMQQKQCSIPKSLRDKAREHIGIKLITIESCQEPGQLMEKRFRVKGSLNNGIAMASKRAPDLPRSILVVTKDLLCLKQFRSVHRNNQD